MAVHGSSERSAEWVKSLPSVIVPFSNETTRLLGMKPKNPIMVRLDEVTHTPSQAARRAIGLEGARISSNALMRYL